MPRRILVLMVATWLPIGVFIASLFLFPGRKSTAQSSAPPVDIPIRMPKAVVERTEYSFGTMDLEQLRKHLFVVHNKGENVLHLQKGRCSSDSIDVEIPEQDIRPGASGMVAVSWQTPAQAANFHETVSVLSNDPENRVFQFAIRGRVETELALHPAHLQVGEVIPHRGAVVHTVIYSHVWDNFTIADVQSSLAAIRWSIEPASRDTLGQLEARSGYRVRIQFPAGLKNGPFNEKLTFQIVRDGIPAGPSVRELALTGRVLRRLAVYGEQIEFTGVVNLDVTHIGREHGVRLLMKVRDEELDLPVRKIVTEPDFLKVRVTPVGSEAAQKGLYYLDVTIPATAPACNHTNGKMGKIHLEFDHPRIPALDLQAHFMVTERSPFYESFLEKRGDEALDSD